MPKDHSLPAKNSLMEWMEQTKRLSKEVDYITLDTIDSIVTALPLVNPQTIRDHANFFNSYCEKYHKPNPVKLIRKRRMLVLETPCTTCPSKSTCMGILDRYVHASVNRCEKAVQMIDWQWFEVIDFMFERPELVNPALVDQYIRDRIFEVCRNHKKNNPLTNGVVARFGKYWRDDKGHWRKERRRRF